MIATATIKAIILAIGDFFVVERLLIFFSFIFY